MVKHVVLLLCFSLLTFAVAEAAPVPLVNRGDIWHYHKGTNAPQADWMTVADAGLNATWAAGNGGFGYASNIPETENCQTLLSDMQNNYTSVYMRRQFVLTNNPAADAHLMLRMDWDDGFIAFLDGNYLTSVNVGSAPAEPIYTNTASGDHESSLGDSSPQPAVTNDLGPASGWLSAGTHRLAIVGLNRTSGSSDCIQVADLFLDVPPPQVTNVWAASNSPIVITTNVTVPNNTVLIIEPGVTVALAAGISITVTNSGRILAEGASNAPILFTRSGTSGSWGNITINGSFNSPETRIAYAHFEFNGGSPCIEVAAGTVYLDHLTFGNTGLSYLHLDGASFVVSDCHFPSATALFENVHGTAGIKSSGRGIFIRNFFGVANSVSGNYNDVLDFTGGNRPGPIVQFINNVFIGSGDDLVDLDGTDAWIEGNIFLHPHKNGSPDSASAISGGLTGSDRSEITIIGNIIYDCDQAATAKEGNFYTLINNTIVHQTKVGGTDTDAAVVNLADTGTTEGVGMYLEGNIIYDAEKLVRNQTAGIVTYTNNLMQLPWTGPGGNNSTTDPMFKHIPTLAETVFTNWAQAQIVWDWFSLQSNSPAIGTGPNGRDKGGVVPLGASVSGEPSGTTTNTSAALRVGVNRAGSGIPATPAAWPNGSGYTHYKWRLDGGTWSAETPIATPITLSNLITGSHYVEVTGKRDSGLYQDDPLFGEDAVLTHSRTWTVIVVPVIENVLLVSSNWVRIEFTAQANLGYTIEYRDSLSTGAWQTLVDLDPTLMTHPTGYTDSTTPGIPMRFYRLVAR